MSGEYGTIAESRLEIDYQTTSVVMESEGDVAHDCDNGRFGWLLVVVTSDFIGGCVVEQNENRDMA